MSIVSWAMRRREAVRHEFQSAHVCRRSASLISSTRTRRRSQQQLAQVLGLLGLARDQLQPLQLGEPFDQRADLVAEHIVDLGARRLGILDRVVQQRGDNRGVIELEVGEDRGDF